jgi:hypothetical protein
MAITIKQQPSKEKYNMASRKKTPALKTYPYLETWDTRYGMSQRVVLRKGGKFIDNTSLTALKQGVRVSSR